MSFNKTVKYFKSIRAYVYCTICNDVISTDINKEDIRNGLQTGLYIYKYKHKNEHADLEDEEDKSSQEHTIAVYINSDYEVKGVKCYIKESELRQGGQGTRFPTCIKDIPPMSVQLGILSPEEYRVLQLCDGNNTMESVSSIIGIPIEDLEKMMQKLREKGLIKIIIKG